MSEPAAQPIFVSPCPSCQKSYVVRAEQAGKSARCKQCGQNFIITPKERSSSPAAQSIPAAAPASAPAPTPEPPLESRPAPAPGELLCPICQCACADGEPVKLCPACNTRHHVDCWEYNRGCGLYGCKECPETEKLQDIEIPASYWGQTEKACPKCGKVIQAAAVRCRHCGVTFQSSRPQESGEFQAKVQQKSDIQKQARIGIWLLVFAVIPCTAPIALVIGGIWYASKRETIAAMPPMNATICRLAVGISALVTVFIVIIAAIYSASAK